MRDDVDLRFHDVVALEEIELYAEVLSAVAAAAGPLTTEEIDEVLGLRERARADVSLSIAEVRPGAPARHRRRTLRRSRSARSRATHTA